MMKKIIFLLVVISIFVIAGCTPKSNPVSPTVSGGESKGTESGSGISKSKQDSNLRITGTIKIANIAYESYFLYIYAYDYISPEISVSFWGKYDAQTKTYKLYDDDDYYNYQTINSYGTIKVIIHFYGCDPWTNISTTELGPFGLHSGNNIISVDGLTLY